ncbi:MAG: isoprenylcysteine carboxylmethyltransferase family protein [Deltaproteobacteria bacterium]|nr:isoprenylcysteine carboxylmethyltransferase family protein [Deltaproteobacteria bacterium]
MPVATPPPRARMLLGALLQPALLALLLFRPPGVLTWRAAWALVGVALAATIASMVVLARADPALLAERFRLPVQRGQSRADRVVVLLFVAAFCGAMRFVPWDVFALRLLPPPGTAVAVCGLGLVLAGWWLIVAAMRANEFAVPVVRSQTERRQRVVADGPYAVVRHPMYAGATLLLVGMPLWLGSTAGALAACVPIALLVVRIGIEERFLRGALPGYDAYAGRVRSRLVPGVW